MISFSQYLLVKENSASILEGYKNFIGARGKEGKERWADQVWDVLQKSYKPLGGIKGSGFNSKQDMIDNIPFWKLYVKNQKVVAVSLYKDSGGRKAVAIGTDGSDLGKKVVSDIFKASLGVSYGEKSGPSLGLMMKSVPWENLKPFLFTPDQVAKVTGKSVTPAERYGIENLNEKDKKTYDKFPQLKPYFYVRELGGHPHLKVSMGTPNLPIV